MEQRARSVHHLTITGTNLWTSAGPVAIETGATWTGTPDISNPWPTQMSFPGGGCWQVDLAARTMKEEPVTAQAVFIVIDG